MLWLKLQIEVTVRKGGRQTDERGATRVEVEDGGTTVVGRGPITAM